MSRLRYREAMVLPLGRDPSSRYGPWIVGAMVYLATLALAAAMVLASAGSEWRTELAGKLTVQVPPPQGMATDDVDRVVRLLRATPGVAEALPLDDRAMGKLLAPWLGNDVAVASLPLPALIDVRLRPGARIDTKALAARLADASPGTTLDDHGVWMRSVLRFAAALRTIAVAIVVVIGVTAVMTVVFATRAGLAAHDEVIEVLHLVGAQDGYIARQFQLHVRTFALKGGAVGFVLAIVTLALLASIAPASELGLLPSLRLGPLQWLALAGLPLAAVAIGMATARLTVMRALARLL